MTQKKIKVLRQVYLVLSVSVFATMVLLAASLIGAYGCSSGLAGIGRDARCDSDISNVIDSNLVSFYLGLLAAQIIALLSIFVLARRHTK